MVLSWGLLRVALLALCWGPSVAGAETVPLQTLQCHNDYTSHIVCRWAHTEDAQRLLNVTLYRQVNGDPPQPVSCDISKDGPLVECPSPHCVQRRCVIPYQLFVLADKDYFSFRPDRPLDAQLTVTLSQHVQPPPPDHLQLSAAGDSVLLTWSVALGGPQTSWLLQENLEFEVAYKRLHDSWEDASTLHANSPRAVLGPAYLLPSTTYVARVRTRLAPNSGFSGRPSQWSPEVRWDSQPGDEAQPHNLQCFFDGARTLSCSWEVRSPVTSSVAFGLFYKSSLEAEEKECSPLLEEELGSLYTRHRCHIPVPDPGAHGQYIVSVRPRREVKFIKSSDNIQMARPTLNVTKDGDSYSLRWQAENMYYKHIEHTFQVQYRKDSAEWEDSVTETLQSAHSMSLPALEPSTKYWARVKVKPTPGAYNGTWSEWSHEISWTTEGALPAWVLPLILVIVTLVLLLVLRFCSLYGYRLNRNWKEKIPSPSKSQLFQDGSARLQFPASYWGFPISSNPPQRPWDSHFPELDRVSSAEFGDSEVSPLTIEDPKVVCDPAPGPDTTPAASGQPVEQPPGPQPSLPAPSCRPANRLPSFDFNGPYLGPPHSRSLPDIGGQLAPPQSWGPAPTGSLEYLCLPPGGQVQLVPLAQAMGQDRAVDAECRPSPGAEGNPSLDPGAGPALPESELRVGGQGPKDGPAALPTTSGDPEDPVVTSAYVTSADLALILPTGAPAPPLGLPSHQNPGLCADPPGGPPEAPAPGKPGFEGYVELPASTGLFPESPRGCPDSPPSNSPTLSPREPREDMSPVSPHIEGLLVLQQVGDYCFLPGLGTGPLSPRSKPSSPGPPPEIGGLDQVSPIKRPPCQPTPQVPAIQFFKSLKHQDYLSLPPWDVSRPREVC